MAPLLLLLCLSTSSVGAQAGRPVPQPAQAEHATAEYYFLLGRYLEGEDKLDEAIGAFKKAIELAPRDAEPRAELAAFYARQDKAAPALDAAEDALKIDPKNKEANRILGSVLAALSEQRQPARPGDDAAGYAKRATQALELARGDGTSDLSLDLALARMYVRQNRFGDAVPLLRRIVEEQPGYADGSLLLASAQESAGQPQAAADTLKALLQAQPSLFRARVQLAELYEQQHQWKDAAEAWTQALALNQRNTELVARRAIALLNSGNAEEAETAARALRVANPDDVRGLYVLGVALQLRNRSEEAAGVLRQAAARAPDNLGILFQLGAALDRAGHQDEAEKVFRDLLSRDPLHATTLNYLGYMLADRGIRLEDAVSLIQRALEVDPENPSYLDSLGWAYVRQGKLDLADPPLTQAAEKLPRNSVIQDHLGDLRMKQNRRSEAITAWQRALDGDGESIDRGRIEKKIEAARSKK